MNAGGVLVFTEAEVHGVAEFAVTGFFGEAELGDEGGGDPRHVAGAGGVGEGGCFAR